MHLVAGFSTVGPSSTKKYNFEDSLQPFKLNSLWDLPGRYTLLQVQERESSLEEEDLVPRKGNNLLYKKRRR